MSPLYKLLDDQASFSGIFVLRLNGKLKSKDVMFLFSQISSTYTQNLKSG